MTTMTERPIRKQVVEAVNLKVVDKLMELASENDLITYTIEGCLLDSHAIITDDIITIGRYKPRKYIIIRESYTNEWSSGLELIMTDDDKELEAFYTDWEAYVDEQEQE